MKRPSRRVVQFALALAALVLAPACFHKATASYFTNVGAMSISRGGHTATLLPNGKVLVVGGYYKDFIFDFSIPTSELFDPANRNWMFAGSLNTARQFHTATLLTNGTVLISGGYNSSIGGAVSSVEIYNPTNETWTLTNGLNIARYGHTATLLTNGNVLVAGGYSEPNLLSSTELYDPNTKLWTSVGSLNNARDDHTATLLPDGRVLVAGGAGGGNTAELYDPINKTWTLTTNLIIARKSHSATLLNNGNALLGGGFSLSSTESYDLTSESWSLAEPLNTGRFWHTASLLPDGMVLIVGGYSSSEDTPLDSAELYNPVANQWRTTAGLNAARLVHTATLLADGTLLVAGGVDGNFNSLDSSELFVRAKAVYLMNAVMLSGGAFHLTFTNTPGADFRILATTNLSTPLSNWSALSGVTEISPGQFQFTDPQATNSSQRFYRVQAN